MEINFISFMGNGKLLKIQRSPLLIVEHLNFSLSDVDCS